MDLGTAGRLCDAMEGVAYVTDRRGTIVAVGQRNWDAFAREARSDRLSATDILGRNVLDAIAGGEVVALYEGWFKRLEAGLDDRIAIPFTCDEPSVARRMRLTISAINAGGAVQGYLFQSVLLDQWSRPPLDIYASRSYANNEDATWPIVRMCSFCQRLHWPVGTDDEWRSAESYYAAGGREKVRLSHGVCTTCLNDLPLAGDPPAGRQH